jgi:deoxyadenosine/deoxycytidine kinase
MNKMRLVISGTVGVGKSTTTELLVKELKNRGYQVNYLKEKTVSSPYLENYYKDPEN